MTVLMYAIEAKLEALCEKLIEKGAKAVRTTPSLGGTRPRGGDEGRGQEGGGRPERIKCRDCPSSFTFSAKQKDFFASKGWPAPIRCKACRDAKKNQR
mmetsp:Transcript_7286/g.11208  ORF Transcript_7286/g.11208 Transcript_7286/m.11208 type:complete len:98 (+) Transcript_7286:272-565(+)